MNAHWTYVFVSHPTLLAFAAAAALACSQMACVGEGRPERAEATPSERDDAPAAASDVTAADAPLAIDAPNTGDGPAVAEEPAAPPPGPDPGSVRLPTFDAGQQSCPWWPPPAMEEWLARWTGSGAVVVGRVERLVPATTGPFRDRNRERVDECDRPLWEYAPVDIHLRDVRFLWSSGPDEVVVRMTTDDNWRSAYGLSLTPIDERGLVDWYDESSNSGIVEGMRIGLVVREVPPSDPSARRLFVPSGNRLFGVDEDDRVIVPPVVGYTCDPLEELEGMPLTELAARLAGPLVETERYYGRSVERYAAPSFDPNAPDPWSAPWGLVYCADPPVRGRPCYHDEEEGWLCDDHPDGEPAACDLETMRCPVR